MNKDLLFKLFNIGLSFFTKKSEQPTKPNPIVNSKKEVINWANPQDKVSKYFTVQEAIYLREWKRLANASDGLNDHVKEQLINIFKIMDIIRELLNKPIFIKSAYRPSAYNVAIGGAKKSAHMCEESFAAVDFWTDQNSDGTKDGKDCDDIKTILMTKLQELNVRMEDNGVGARWVHVDNKPISNGMNRFFKP